jgi:hypothetical protein
LGSVTFLGLGRKAGPEGCAGGAPAIRTPLDAGCGDARRFVVASWETIMAKRKKDRLRVHKEARRLARLGVGMPPAERTIPDKRQKAPKHKKKVVAPELN